MKTRLNMKFMHWYQTRPVREQWMLAAGGVTITCWLLWFGVIQPMGQANALATSRLNGAQQALLEVRELSQQLISARAQQSTASGRNSVGLAQWIYATADQNNVTLASVDLSADGMSASLRTDALTVRDTLEWLYALESESLAQVENVILNPAVESSDQNMVVAALSLRWR